MADLNPTEEALRGKWTVTSQVRVVDGYYDLDTGKVEWSAK
jgi:hypothetical protein